MNYQKIVTLYDTTEHAEAARRNLESAGFPGREISVVTRKTLVSGGDKLFDIGLWHRLFGRDIEQHEAAVYGRTVDTGGAVLTIRVSDEDAPRATAILNAHNAVDVMDRAVKEGLITEEARQKVAQPATRAAGGVYAGEEVLQLAEEQLDVGKRVVEEGTTRIRRFVTEKPVEATVTLHEEHVQVIRRASNDPNFTRNIDWTDKTVEMMETIEEPVITKSAHVVEEVVIRKEATDRVETVRDKIRRQDVEVEQKKADKRKKA
jgi:stress response protein YsnF